MRNFNEITAKLSEMEIDAAELDNFEWDSELRKRLEEEFGAIKIVEDYGGEGQGESYYKTFHFVDHDVYLKYDAYYQSYEGTDFSDSDFREVHPKTETRTIYE